MENLVLSKNITEQKIISFNFPLYSGITTIAFGSTQLDGEQETEYNQQLSKRVYTKFFCKIRPHHSDYVEKITLLNFKNYVDCDALLFPRKTIANHNFSPLLISNTADCPIILVSDTHLRTSALIHSGWKGTQKNIVGKTIKLMLFKHRADEWGYLKSKDLMAFVWPGICESCYELGAEREKHFPGKIKNGHLNLKEIIVEQLQQTGVENIISTDACSYHWRVNGQHVLHSHRREHNGKRNCVFLST